jgi:RimJ/RimL family protein N-acetyltransferase
MHTRILTSSGISIPQSKKDASDYQKHVAENTMLGVVFCLHEDDKSELPKAIGTIHFDGIKQDHAHHRNSMVGIDALPEYQGKGYGSEAILWALRWAFVTRGLHRVNISAFGYNEGAIRLYERLGFVLEGKRREFVWFEGKWYDDYTMGMLEHEWRDRYGHGGA